MFNPKCPNCGSTAQVVFIDQNRVECNLFVETYRCGCGCVFSTNRDARQKQIITSKPRFLCMTDRPTWREQDAWGCRCCDKPIFGTGY